jgi:hypothetical protein
MGASQSRQNATSNPGIRPADAGRAESPSGRAGKHLSSLRGIRQFARGKHGAQAAIDRMEEAVVTTPEASTTCVNAESDSSPSTPVDVEPPALTASQGVSEATASNDGQDAAPIPTPVETRSQHPAVAYETAGLPAPVMAGAGRRLYVPRAKPSIVHMRSRYGHVARSLLPSGVASRAIAPLLM